MADLTTLKRLFGLMWSHNPDDVPPLPLAALKPLPGKRVRTGVTKNHGKPRDKARARMARESRKRNRGR